MAWDKRTIQLAVVLAVGWNAWIWYGIAAAGGAESAVYFLDAGQGDAQLVALASGSGEMPVHILIDGGRDRRVLEELDAALGKNNAKYIDIIMVTHPHLDHFGGIVEVLKRYDAGLFLSNGEESDTEAYRALQEQLAERGVPSYAIRKGDVLRYRDARITVLSPDAALLGAGNVDEASLVLMLEARGSRALFTGDAGLPAERILLASGEDLDADILKVGHHGSKNSSGENFVAAVEPLVAAIGVGQNRYGHPAPQTLAALELAGARIHRTDRDGTLKVLLDKGSGASAAASLRNKLAAVAELFTHRPRGGISVLSLSELSREPLPSRLVSYATCSFADGANASPAHAPVVISEVAWMGSEESPTHEWIKLKRIRDSAVNLSGWQLLNENERVRVTFPQQTVLEERFLVLARSAANDALRLDADLLFSGALRNTNEGLRLFDNTCRLIDEVLAAPNWPAGDNRTKETMKRESDFSWRTFGG